MKNPLSTILVSIVVCLLVSHQAEAYVDSQTHLSYYEPTNSIFVWANVTVDYETLAYYCVDDWGQVIKNDESLDTFWGGTCDQSEIYYDNYFPFDSSANYSIEIYPQVISKHNYPIGDGYDDYYNYAIWASADPYYEVNYMNFFGPGPETEIDYPSILLGGVFGIFTQGGQSSVPHHLRVNTDFDIVLQSPDGCGQVRKFIEYTVVDQQNRGVGGIRIDEKPQQNLIDSCSGTTVTLTTCNANSVSRFGNFTDGIKTGCPHTGPTPCGFDWYNRWRWCRNSPYGPTDYIDIATIYYWARRDWVKIDNETNIQDGTYKWP
jgi:hypothetical protein